MAYDFHDLIKSLNIFSQSTDDFYYLFDYEKKTFYFSDNIKEANNALASLDTTLSAEKWQTIIDPRDVKRLNTILAENTQKTLIEIEKDTERDYFMSAEEALEYGLIDKIIYNNEKKAVTIEK